MTSVLTSTRQTASSYYVNLVDDLSNFIYSEASVKAALADLTQTTTPEPVGWDDGDILNQSVGVIFLKDMGKSLTGQGLTFRKVQLIISDVSTSGVGGTATAADPFLTGYILLGLNGANDAFDGGYVISVAKCGF